MSTNAESELEQLRARMKAQNDFAAEHGEKWVKHYDHEFKRLPKGTIVVINCRTGEYVLGPNRLKAGTEYERRFGKGKDVGYMIEIGGISFVGGGYWLR